MDLNYALSLSLSLQKKAKGAELFEQIMYHLDVVEKDYFGLRFMDSAQVPVRVKKFLESECKICFNMGPGSPDLIITFLFITIYFVLSTVLNISN